MNARDITSPWSGTPLPDAEPPSRESRPGAAAAKGAGREGAIVNAFVDIVDAMAAGTDVGDMLDRLVQRCTGLLGTRSAGILLPDRTGPAPWS